MSEATTCLSRSTIDSLKSLDTDALKAIIGVVMTELRTRKSALKSEPAAPKATPIERAVAKEEYHAKKAEYAARPFGIMRTADGKLLKRRFNDASEAQAQAVELTATMKAGYTVVEVAGVTA